MRDDERSSHRTRCAPTATRTYWVITVRDRGDLEAGIRPYERRFEFDDLEEAYRCARAAREADLEISVAKVATSRTSVPSSTTSS
jgi:hypothetical protein